MTENIDDYSTISEISIEIDRENMDVSRNSSSQISSSIKRVLALHNDDYNKNAFLENSTAFKSINDKSNAPENIKVLVSQSLPSHNGYYKKTQRWKGTITKILDEEFIAKLEDVNKPDTYETATFDFQDISQGDIALIELGKVFYWSVGYFVTQTGQVKKESFIRFQRLPNWTTTEMDKITDKARELEKGLRWD